MRILGIDPGLSTAGLGLIEVDAKNHLKALDWLTIEISTSLSLQDRLSELADNLEEYLRESKPDLAVVEQLFFAANKKSALEIAHARGVILLVLKRHSIPMKECTPLQLKMAVTGDGRADKKQMQSMVQRILKLTELPTPADAADGLALALYGAFTRNTKGH